MLSRTLSVPSVSRWCALLVSGAVLGFAQPALAADDTPQITVDRAEVTLQAFTADPRFADLNDELRQSRAVLIVPEYRRGGLGIGGEGGAGVLLRRDAAKGAWSYPAFFDLAGLSLGPQIGFESGEMLILIRDKATLQSILKGSYTIDANASVVAGGMGASGTASATAEGREGPTVLLRTSGAYAGASLKAVRLSPMKKWNAAYYSRKSTPAAIVGSPGLSNPKADVLRDKLRQIARENPDTAQLPPS